MKLFWSYARRDDKSGGQVSRLREAFENALSQAAGADCEVYIDHSALGWGVKWREEIDRLVRESDGLVAIVTPSYFNSRMCMFELQTALESGKKVLPIYYRTCRRFESTFKEDGLEAEINKKLNAASRRIGELQMKDFRALRNKKPGSKAVRDFLDALAEELA